MSGAVRCGIIGLLGAAFAAGCSVKESRDDCLCLLRIEFPQTDSIDMEGTVLALSGAECPLFVDTLESVAKYETYVPKKLFAGNVWKGVTEGFISENGLVIPYGDACPEVYMYSFVADCRGESLTEEVLLRKNFCRILVRITDSDAYPYDVAFHGNVDGYDVYGNPRNGAFAYTAHRSADGTYSIVVPRQTDNSLMMDITDANNVFRSFAIGEYITASGYDWSAPDLADVTVLLDYNVVGIAVHVERWENEYEYDIVL